MADSFVNNQGIKTRFLTTLFVNIARVGLGFISGIVIARGLGPADYGNYSFLLGSFISISTMLDMGTSEAFYTFLSQRRRGGKFYLYYFLWTIIQFAVVALLISFVFPDTWRNAIWLGHAKSIIILAFIASFATNKIWHAVIQAGESIRATVLVQLHNVLIASLYLGCVLFMLFFKNITLSNLFIVAAATYLVFSLILTGRLRPALIGNEDLKLSNFINEFKPYCAPLVIYGIVGFIYLFANVWLLQKFGGPIQQAFYSIGMRFSSICLVVTASVIKVFWKETAEANQLGDKKRLHYLYTKISWGICFVSAVGVCYLIPFSREILHILLGPAYEAGWLCLAIIFLYTIYDGLFQVNATYLYSTGQTRLRSMIGSILRIVSIPVAYFVLAPSSSVVPGLGLGSVGLALKMVIFHIVTVNLLSYFICKISKWDFNFLYQFRIIGLMLAISLSGKKLLIWGMNFLNLSFSPSVLIISCFPIYILIVGATTYMFPEFVGIKREEMLSFVHNITTYFTKRKK